jgi:hypothetical protein
MKHLASRRFWHAYEKLPHHIRELADRNFALLKQDPAHPSLQEDRPFPVRPRLAVLSCDCS